uniref:Uncharacterized protein n=1 Tax=Anguilla anguilla TaxID=7936 RepID=A0A0E9VFP7_ANGAN
MQADRRMDSQTDRQTLISVNHAQGVDFDWLENPTVMWPLKFQDVF